MCGFVGFLDASGVLRTGSESVLRKMAARIASRGPDGEGYWVDESLQLAFAHRRLAIQDLSPLGAQPMKSPSGRFMMVFNGEIYNFIDIRSELEQQGFSFRGHSDTEVMLAAFECWGISPALQRFVGMFAFALCDIFEQKLYLARDRLGEKPLYYGWQSGTFLFGSELKSFQPHPAWNGTIDRNSLTLLLRHNYIPAPHSIYEGIKKLEPASLLTMELANPKDAVVIERYWFLEQVYAQPNYSMERQERLDEL